MHKKIAIVQSNYIPWKGYFNIIKCVDEFVLLDDVQYTRRDWRNRNIIKTESGLKWLSIPVEVKGQYLIDIKDVKTAGTGWRSEHWNQIMQAYKKAPYYSWLRPVLEDLYSDETETNLSQINYNFIQRINMLLNIETPVRWSMEFDAPKGKTDRLLHICKVLGASEYISGVAAKDYLVESLFTENNIAVKWADYSNYPVYRQLHGPFEHSVSIIDLLFNEGPDAHRFLKDKLWN
jgi:hypothetical protein